MKRVNTTRHLVLTDEDCRAVRSDVGKKLIHEQEQTTTAKQKRKITKKDSLLSNQDIKRWYDNRESEEEISRQRIVTPEEFEGLITKGWQYLGTLPNGKIVIKNRQDSN